MLRAAQEGIVFALNHGMTIMRAMGIEIRRARAGHANMFLSPLFAEAFATVTGITVELYDTDGAQGAARGAGLGSGVFSGADDAFAGLSPVRTIDANEALRADYTAAYERWAAILEKSRKRSG